MICQAKFLVLFLVLFLITGTVSAAAQSEGNPGDNPKIPRHNLLNLSPEQKTKLKELRENFRKETVFLRNDIKIKRLEIQTLWTVPKPDKEKIIAKQKELMDLKTQLKLKAIDYRIEARNTLTPEQAAQVGLWGSRMGHKGHSMGRPMMDRF
jgi:Spy/CpxP family protein refolding chaperone